MPPNSIIETLRGQRVAAILLGVGPRRVAGHPRLGPRDKPPGASVWTAANTAHSTQGSGNGQCAKASPSCCSPSYVFRLRDHLGRLLITAGARRDGARPPSGATKDDDRSQPAKMRERFAPGNYPAPEARPGCVRHPRTSVATAARPCPTARRPAGASRRSCRRAKPDQRRGGAESAR